MKRPFMNLRRIGLKKITLRMLSSLSASLSGQFYQGRGSIKTSEVEISRTRWDQSGPGRISVNNTLIHNSAFLPLSEAPYSCSFVFIVMFLLQAWISASSCSAQNAGFKKPFSGSSDHCITRAGKFSLQKNDSCTVLTITDPWQGAEGQRLVYYLVKRGTKALHFRDTSNVIYVPVRKIICTSTTHIAMIDALGEDNAISGVSGARYIFNPLILRRIGNGLVRDIGFDAGLNSELILKLKPDLLIMYGVGSEALGYTAKIKELGIKVLFDAEYLETDPLGKAEWIKLFGALFCREKMADSIYSSVEAKYDQIKEYVRRNSAARPLVLLGLPFKDTWYISPGNSYISMIIEDAGGDYLWNDKKSSESMPYSFENVYLQSLKAEFWLNIGTVNSRHEIADFDPRLGTIPAYRYGNLFNNNKRVSEEGSNDYWESGTVNPQVILKDIASILHPGIFGDYVPVYYKKIE